MTLSLTVINHLRQRRRTLALLVWLEHQDGDLYAWTGARPISWDGQTWLGLGYLVEVPPVRKSDAIEHLEHRFKLVGLDPTIIGDLDTSVRGNQGKMWIAAMDGGQIVQADILMEFVQDTLTFTRDSSDTLSLELTCHEALPFLGRSKKELWTHETWLQRFGDTGFIYNSEIAQEGEAVEWILD